jgi:hypothetical protein
MRRDLEELRKARKAYDERVYVFVKNHAPLTRAMNIEKGVVIPEVMLEREGRSMEYKRMRVVDGCLQRLKDAGRIECVKEGTPYWKIVEA